MIAIFDLKSSRPKTQQLIFLSLSRERMRFMMQGEGRRAGPPVEFFFLGTFFFVLDRS